MAITHRARLTFGGRYVATLEARIKSLERRLRAKDSNQVTKARGPTLTPDTACSDHHDRSRGVLALDHPSQLHQDQDPINQVGACDLRSESSNFAPRAVSTSSQSHDPGASGHGQSSLEPERSTGAAHLRPSGDRQIPGLEVTVLDVLHGRSFASSLQVDSLPALPPSSRARALVDTVYFYTQARYCIVDWAKLREWHRDRDSIAYISTDGPIALQTGTNFINWESIRGINPPEGAFFIWIIYAIGDCLVPNPESSTEVGARSLVIAVQIYLISTGLFLSCSSLPPSCDGIPRLNYSTGALMSNPILLSRPGKRSVLSRFCSALTSLD